MLFIRHYDISDREICPLRSLYSSLAQRKRIYKAWMKKNPFSDISRYTPKSPTSVD